ncbi:ribonuclease Z [Natronobacterium gregoryi]|uniref:Ribonuclease Z n=2 Tax=Natronobacterium gregoryi TaxID=44930 RepID=L0AHS7_NATGS|nr:ribonuclease Z [Natronobacterium gregoryi]AFZ72999.1 ribonuclease Z [Natronobacterium gregoryi SP2]ELY70066.1 ribonuclease Z [Natronobacterium gregoryi SP2]PLK19076.1 ribonuclease Z [Natronobacterium gregoryi SP2]SFJ62556.1 RNAse Z [Natronobacterium gregoryi]
MPLRVTFLGTSGAVPTTERNPSGIFLARDGEELLFDAGEGTQRQMMRFGTGFSVSHLFVTHLHGDHVFGIPGLLQTMDFNDREEPLSIHAPHGTRRKLQGLVNALGNHPSFPVHVTEVGDGDVAYRADEYEVRAFETDHDARSVGYALVEDDRKGRFDRERAEELGVPVGPKFSKLHEGQPVELEDGTVVEPDQVVGDPRPGRTIVYTGDTRPTVATIEVADEPDLLIHDATFADDRAERATETAHSTARGAAEIAARAGAKRLALMHISSRYAGHTAEHERQAREAFDGEVILPEDGDELEIPYSDD